MPEPQPFQVPAKDGDVFDAALLNRIVEEIEKKLAKTDPRVPVFDAPIRAYWIGTGE